MKHKQKMKNQKIIGDIWDSVSYKWKGLIIGSGFGMLTYLIINPLLSNKLAVLIAAFFIPVLMSIGILIGSSYTWLEDLRDC